MIQGTEVLEVVVAGPGAQADRYRLIPCTHQTTRGCYTRTVWGLGMDGEGCSIPMGASSDQTDFSILHMSDIMLVYICRYSYRKTDITYYNGTHILLFFKHYVFHQ